MLLFLDTEEMRADLAARRVSCPSCPGRLAPWAHARPRVVSMLGGRRVRLTPRRARCTSCRKTQVLLPAWCAPRRAHGVEVIATALGAQLPGQGHRVIAEGLEVPAGTVRGWLRRVSGRAAQLRCTATRQLCELDPTAAPPGPTGSALGEALGALAAGGRGPATPRSGCARAGVGADRAARAGAVPATCPRRMINIGGCGLARAREPPTP